MDDLTLSKMLTEAYRGQVDYCDAEGMSVSQSSSFVCSMDQGNLWEKWSMDQGNLMSEIAPTHRLGLYLRSKDRQFLWNVTQESDELQTDPHKGQLRQQKLEFREAHQRSFSEMEEIRKCQSSALINPQWKFPRYQSTSVLPTNT